MTDEKHPDDDTFPNPLASEGSLAPVDLGEGEPTPTPPDPDGTARMVTDVADWLVTAKWNAPLSEKESAELQADLGAVLAKHEVPNLPFHEELKLSMTVGGIVFRRAVAAREGGESPSEAPAEPSKTQGRGGLHVDHTGLGKEGKREVRAASEDMFCRVGAEGRPVLS